MAQAAFVWLGLQAAASMAALVFSVLRTDAGYESVKLSRDMLWHTGNADGATVVTGLWAAFEPEYYASISFLLAFLSSIITLLLAFIINIFVRKRNGGDFLSKKVL